MAVTMTMEGAVLEAADAEAVFGTPLVASAASLVFNLTAPNATQPINCDQGMPDVFSGAGRVSSSPASACCNNQCRIVDQPTLALRRLHNAVLPQK